MFELKPDFEQALKRFEAWWDAEILDRALTSIRFARPAADRVAEPAGKTYASHRDRWMDSEYRARQISARLHNTVHFADALPVAYPNLGPEVFSAFYGCPMRYGETTAWSEPLLRDWGPESVGRLQVDLDGFYFRKVMELTDALLDAGRDRFLVGYTDIHPGGNCLAAFRDPQQLCLDLLERPAEVRALCERVTDDFLRVYDLFYEKLAAAGMPSTTWVGATCKGRFHVPSNDFSCMISDELFEEFFLPGIVRECRHMDRCIYHLDGPQALRYLDTLLEIPEIQAIQWVPGAGHDAWSDQIGVYRRIQAAGKAFQMIRIPATHLNDVFEALRPEGAWLSVYGLDNEDEARAALKAIERWAC